MRRALGLIVLLLVASGCQSGGSEPEGYKASDFKPRPRPEGFGPGNTAPATPPTGG